jgi:hypothetical protein
MLAHLLCTLDNLDHVYYGHTHIYLLHSLIYIFFEQDNLIYIDYSGDDVCIKIT